MAMAEATDGAREARWQRWRNRDGGLIAQPAHAPDAHGAASDRC